MLILPITSPVNHDSIDSHLPLADVLHISFEAPAVIETASARAPKEIFISGKESICSAIWADSTSSLVFRKALDKGLKEGESSQKVGILSSKSGLPISSAPREGEVLFYPAKIK